VKRYGKYNRIYKPTIQEKTIEYVNEVLSFSDNSKASEAGGVF